MMDQLIRLDAVQAENAYFDRRNDDRLFRLLPLFTASSLLAMLWLLADGRYIWLLLPALNLWWIRWLYSRRESPTFLPRLRWIIAAFFVLQVATLRSLFWPYPFHPLDFLLPLVLLAFRLPWPSMMVALLTMGSVAAGRVLSQQMQATDPWQILWSLCQIALLLLVLWLNHHWNQGLRGDFIDAWRRENRRSKERERMREELGDARRIQLSMLPQRAPTVAGLDMAGISIPASEVGGDYYDYFPLDDHRLLVVVADVAGHGVASGLILSGIRSCLHLLLETPPSPVEVLQKLDRVVRQTAGKRHFVTMIYAFIDLDQRRLTVAAAGHPPLLHARRGSVDELGRPSLPLGTPLEGTFQQVTASFAPGDTFLLYTDGIAETCNDREDAYGNERLHQRLAAFAGPRPGGAQRSAREIRDTLLSDIVQFKGDAEQTDDITVVVVRVEPEDTSRQ